MRIVMSSILLLLASTLFAQESLYSITAENLPDVGEEQTVYLGDKMLEQRFGYYVQCLTPKQELVFAQTSNEQECLKSTERFEKKCCIDGIRKIDEGGLLCPRPGAGKHPQYSGENFYSFERRDGTEQTKMSWTLRENKKNKRWYQEPAGAKVVDLPKEEFDKAFVPQRIFDVELLKMEQGVRICKEFARDYFQTEGQNRVDSGSIKTKYQQDQTEVPETFSGGGSRAVTLLNDGNNLSVTQKWSWDGVTFDPLVNDPIWVKDGGRKQLSLIHDLTFEEAFDESRPYRIKKDSLQQSIEYAGRTGDVLTFIYSEFTGGMARDAFTREFRIDLSEGSMGAFKGAVFEVLKASNATITYKIVRHFPDDK